MQRQIVIPGNPGIALARVAPALSEWLGPEGYVLGGGTVLAARWQHRVSTDIDLFTDLARYQGAIVSERENVGEALRSLVGAAGEGAVEVERGWLRVQFAEAPVALMTIPRPTVQDPYDEWVQGTGVPTESTAEILARKVQSRILDLGVFTARDLYDILVAAERDRAALRRVLASITAAERAAIAGELRALPRDWTGDQPVREPVSAELLTDLPRRARALFEAPTP